MCDLGQNTSPPWTLVISSVKWKQWLLLYYGATPRIKQDKFMKTLHTVKPCRHVNLSVCLTLPKVVHQRGGVKERLSKSMPLSPVSWWPFMGELNNNLGAKEQSYSIAGSVSIFSPWEGTLCPAWMMPCEVLSLTASVMFSHPGVQSEAGRWDAPGSPGLGSTKVEKHFQLLSEL